MNDEYKKFFKKIENTRREPSEKPQFPLTKKASEKKLRQILRPRKAKPPFPTKAAVGMAVTLVLVVTYVMAPDWLEKLFSRVEIHAIGAADAKDEKPVADAAEKTKKSGSEVAKDAATPPSEGKGKRGETAHGNSEDTSYFEKLNQRKEELDLREKELGQLEEELQRQKVELDKRIQQLEDLRSQIAQILKDRVDVDQEKVTKLVDLYSNMKPKQAADVIGTINEDLAVEVLAKMKKKNAAEIMNLLPAEKARTLSEKYTGYKRQHGMEPKG